MDRLGQSKAASKAHEPDSSISRTNDFLKYNPGSSRNPENIKYYTRLSHLSTEVKSIENYTNCIEVGHLANWSVSSCKSNHGVKNLRDLEYDTYWQSEGQQPHYINIRFKNKIEICFLRFYIEEAADESYTPAVISIKIGNNEQDLVEVLNYNITNAIKYQEGGSWIYCSLEKNSEKNCSNEDGFDAEDIENASVKVNCSPFVDDPVLPERPLGQQEDDETSDDKNEVPVKAKPPPVN